MEESKGKGIKGYPKVISIECSKIIIEQMEKNICRINIGEKKGTGFFCKIPFPDKNNMLPIFITNNHIINQNYLDKKNNIPIYIYENKEIIKEINIVNRMKYTNEEYDVTIIEIKEEDNIKNYLELDDTLINNYNNDNREYIDETVYMMQYARGKLSVSYGIIKSIYQDKKYDFMHKCSGRFGSSGSPILNINNNKIIGIHKEGYKYKFNIGTFLNYPFKDFIQQFYKNNRNNKIDKKYNNRDNKDNRIVLQEFITKYDLNLSDINNKLLNLCMSNLGNEVLEDISNISFKELKKLDLSYNNISILEVLEKTNFTELEILDLSQNKITDINILEKVNFKELKELYLSKNEISDIKVLEKVEFNKLDILDLSHNKISNINALEKCNFKDLKQLYLVDNNLSDIKVFDKLVFHHLETLDLSNNKISDISTLEKACFKELKKLYLSANIISDINVLEKVKFIKLEKLDLNNNKIEATKNFLIISKLKCSLKEFSY